METFERFRQVVGKEIAVDREVSGGGRGMTNSGDSCKGGCIV